ncbi:P-loop containing nucleoside triphosphate hydrolase protein [Gloeophyllum trabeum ATCC 11539]|uniref:p-loop containing nucleoside triphosphate hydrolase protein n=1 Tax=Gloeophyllum trabeum (strain ATCC 11539 / FP-39264 / Madison 617) TaxID=670483 RepID=S7S000_GLOTA|nr:P-loop containing nucleoside triphosphate hydrolase protein [Gloeophyllum trabeum ATCC 11539]EPQ59004.1 P-loop containing nucleoside triphosphate hydrolase protein [Gloeophyllum trabeum ATCC 11539]
MPSNVEDAFIKVSFKEVCDNDAVSSADPLYDYWMDQASGKRSGPELYGTNALRKLYPDHSLVLTPSDVLLYPGARAEPIAPSDVITNLLFIPLARRSAAGPGVLLDEVFFGSFKVFWNNNEFILYTTKWYDSYILKQQNYLLYDCSEAAMREFLLEAGKWSTEVHEEIWVFNQGYWRKDGGLWAEVQKADWKDVILKEEFKTSLKKDIFGFFSSEDLYKELAIPWKRGLIMYGPPGNGKTVSIKAIMKGCEEKGYLPLYVKSFQSYMGEEASMALVFNKARQLAPCVVIMEDLDSLINESNRSFFLNQIDGLEGNDGLLLIGTTNHVERLDPALASRPSRFDRKYLFDDPDLEERTLYCKYWQKKLERNKAVDFPDDLVYEIAKLTDKFSFAYLKEAFVSTLVLLVGDREKDSQLDFATVIRQQIAKLRKELGKQPSYRSYSPVTRASPPTRALDAASPEMQVQMQQLREGNLRSMASAAASLGRSFMF